MSRTTVTGVCEQCGQAMPALPRESQIHHPMFALACHCWEPSQGPPKQALHTANHHRESPTRSHRVATAELPPRIPQAINAMLV